MEYFFSVKISYLVSTHFGYGKRSAEGATERVKEAGQGVDDGRQGGLQRVHKIDHLRYTAGKNKGCFYDFICYFSLLSELLLF